MSNDQGLIEKINRQVNALKLRETVDRGTGAIPGGCRQYVLEKQRRLVAAGIDPSRLEPYTVIRPASGQDPGGLHGVLLVDGNTDHPVVLDNLTPWVTPKKDMEEGRNGYIFLTPWTQPQQSAAAAAPLSQAATSPSPQLTALMSQPNALAPQAPKT